VFVADDYELVGPRRLWRTATPACDTAPGRAAAPARPSPSSDARRRAALFSRDKTQTAQTKNKKTSKTKQVNKLGQRFI
jgi:hypothetical protein